MFKRLESYEDIRMYRMRQKEREQVILVTKIKLEETMTPEDVNQRVESIINGTDLLSHKISNQFPGLIKFDKNVKVSDIVHHHDSSLTPQEIRDMYLKVQDERVYYVITEPSGCTWVASDHTIFDGMAILKTSYLFMREDVEIQLPSLFRSKLVYLYYLYFPLYIFKMATIRRSLVMDLDYKDPKYAPTIWDCQIVKDRKNRLKVSFVSALMADFLRTVMKKTGIGNLSVAVIGAFNDISATGTNSYSLCVINVKYNPDIDKMSKDINSTLMDNRYQFILYPTFIELSERFPDFLKPKLKVDCIFSAFPTNCKSIIEIFELYYFRLSIPIYIQALSSNGKIHMGIMTRVSDLCDRELYVQTD